MDHDALLPRILAKLFPEARERTQAEALLAAYGREEHHREIARVRVAVLKLAGADLERIALHTKVADQDYRDVLSGAEYPNHTGRWWVLPKSDPDRYRALVEADARQYREWIERVLGADA